MGNMPDRELWGLIVSNKLRMRDRRRNKKYITYIHDGYLFPPLSVKDMIGVITDVEH